MGIETVHDKVLVLNGDMPLVTPDSLKPMLEREGDIVMSVFDLPDPSGYGRVVVENSEVKAIVEEKDCTEEQKEIKTVNAGVYIFKKGVLERYLPRLSNDNAQAEYYLTDIIKMAREDGLHIVPVWVEEEDFKGVNSRYDLAHAEEMMQKRVRDICDSHIKSHTVIEDADIKNSSCGPMARIRPGTVLEDTQIGNFVEVKKSRLKGVKAGHLSITCNYDGINKYKTKIGKNVFIGSDTQLVAPVTIEDNVMVAAGTTVTHDVKDQTGWEKDPYRGHGQYRRIPRLRSCQALCQSGSRCESGDERSCQTFRDSSYVRGTHEQPCAA